MAHGWLVVVGVAVFLLLRWRWHLRRYPDKGCRRCQGAGRLTSGGVFGGVVSGLCRRCGGSPWFPRRFGRGVEH